MGDLKILLKPSIIWRKYLIVFIIVMLKHCIKKLPLIQNPSNSFDFLLRVSDRKYVCLYISVL